MAYAAALLLLTAGNGPRRALEADAAAQGALDETQSELDTEDFQILQGSSNLQLKRTLQIVHFTYD